MPKEGPHDRDVSHLIADSIDAHMHTAPDVFSRHDTDFSAARRARDHGMRAIVIKTHHFETASRAALARQETGFEVIGGMTLNDWVGGLNPKAVEGLAKFDPGIVWLPTIAARNHLAGADIQEFKSEEGGEGIYLLEEDGGLKPEVVEILETVAANDIVLATGHVSTDEAFAVVEAAREEGVKEIVITHPMANFLQYDLNAMRRITDMGATLEFIYLTTTPRMGNAATVAEMAEIIDELGAENAIVATDAGSTDVEPAVEMFVKFVQELLAEGLSEAQIETLIKGNPSRIFSLD